MGKQTSIVASTKHIQIIEGQTQFLLFLNTHLALDNPLFEENAHLGGDGWANGSGECVWVINGYRGQNASAKITA